MYLKPVTHITAIAPYRIYPAKMGGQKGIALFYEFLSRVIPVTIVSTKKNTQPASLQGEFLPVLSNSKLRYINPFLFYQIKNILKKNNSLHLILEHPYYGWLGILLKRFCNIKLIVHSHNIESLRFRSTGKWWWKILWNYEKWVHHCADINFFITDEDRHYAIKHFNLEKHKCHTITYGMELNDKPSIAERLKAKKILQETYPINDLDRIMLFNGTLDYKPNLDALDVILERINPLLLNQKKIGYKIIICGKNLPLKYDQLTKYKSKNIIYAGFVDDINLYFEGADIFLNPLVDGGGIKTKLVEALGYNLCCVSTKSGAIGVDPAITGDKLWITVDNDWQNFTNSIFEINIDKNIPPAFFNHFYWGNIARKAAAALIDLMSEIK